jgi:hypothetical protein
MTVVNRSNDLIWGCCGANAVHFPILQEYLAGRIGVLIGQYWQISNNLHLYIELHKDLCERSIRQHAVERYEPTAPLIEYPKEFDNELYEIMQYIDIIHNMDAINSEGEFYTGNISNTFLRDVVIPMAIAHRQYKLKDIARALATVETVKAEDWKTAGKQWLERRHVRR